LSLLSSSLSSSEDIDDTADDLLSTNIRVVFFPHVSAVIFPAQTKYAVTAKAYWQHTWEDYVKSSGRTGLAV
jgi:hypothetical protein